MSQAGAPANPKTAVDVVKGLEAKLRKMSQQTLFQAERDALGACIECCVFTRGIYEKLIANAPIETRDEATAGLMKEFAKSFRTLLGVLGQLWTTKEDLDELKVLMDSLKR